MPNTDMQWGRVPHNPVGYVMLCFLRGTYAAAAAARNWERSPTRGDQKKRALLCNALRDLRCRKKLECWKAPVGCWKACAWKIWSAGKPPWGAEKLARGKTRVLESPRGVLGSVVLESPRGVLGSRRLEKLECWKAPRGVLESVRLEKMECWEAPVVLESRRVEKLECWQAPVGCWKGCAWKKWRAGKPPWGAGKPALGKLE